MQIKIRAFGIAKDILSVSSMEYEVDEGTTIHQLKKNLIRELSTRSGLTCVFLPGDVNPHTTKLVVRQLAKTLIVSPTWSSIDRRVSKSGCFMRTQALAM